MDTIKDGWFSEINAMWPGQCLSLQVTEVLHREKSKFQDILVFQSRSYGKVLVLDGVIQVTERDEFAYQEMMALLPINSHHNPEKVLLIGGGDGGIVRELNRHPSVKEIVLCEIDEKVIEVSKKFFPTLACGFDSPKLRLHVGDGFQFVKEHPKEFDVIITDSSDPVGPAEALFQRDYYVSLKNALRPGGILCSQGESMWLNLDLIRDMRHFCEDLFPVVSFAQVAIPTYPCGSIGCLLCSTSPDTDFTVPVRSYTADEVDEIGWKYYNSEIHAASFALPQFAKLALCSEKKTNGSSH